MSFAFFYLIALIPVTIGFLLWFCDRRFTWWEWALNSAVAFAVAGSLHFICTRGMTADEETWSGEVTSVEYRPEWRERYQEAIYRTETYTTGSGKNRTTHTRRVFSHYETRYRTHPDQWTAETNIDLRRSIDRERYEGIRLKLGGKTVTKSGIRSTWSTGSTMVGGDPNDYYTPNSSGAVVPVVQSVNFENRVKASPSVFSYEQPSEETREQLYAYPVATDTWRSGRVLGAPLNGERWDEMNARLGPSYHVNVILAQLPSRQLALAQEALWVGGKKNDLVLCYGNGWSYVFGWSDSEITKRNLESLLLKGLVDNEIIPAIAQEIRETYQPVDWHKFDYLDLQARPRDLAWLIGSMVVTQLLVFAFGFFNGEDKCTS